MSFDKVVVSTEEISRIQLATDTLPPSLETTLSPVSWLARIGLAVLIVFLPILCLATIIVRVALRGESPRVKYAWLSYLSTLLVISGFLNIAITVALISFIRVPAMMNTSLPELDARSQFPALPSPVSLSTVDISARLKPLVIVVSAVAKLWNYQEIATTSLGAGVLLHADDGGYLFATANHVANASGWISPVGSAHVLVATVSGAWAKADVIAQAPQLDLALLWVARHSGKGEFVQPLATARDGAEIFVIGHPEGLRFSLSTGIVSGLRDQSIQISAPVSPGNSGGPVYDDRGNLVGIVSSKFDHNRDANAENLAFAAKSDALLQPSDWQFLIGGKQLLESYIRSTGNDWNASSINRK